MRAVLSLLVGTALLLSGSGLVTTTLGIRLASGGRSLGVAGVVVSCFAVGLVLGSWRGARLVRRVGHIRAFAGFGGILAAATLGIALVDSPLLWTALRVAQGFVLGGAYLVIESWLGTSAHPSDRARVLAVYIMTCQVALAVGQLLVSVVPESAALLLSALLFVLSLVPVAWTRQKEPRLEEGQRLGFAEMTRRAPVATAGCVVAGCTVGALLNLGASYATALGASVEQVAAFIASAVLGGLVLQWPVGYVADRVDRRLVIELVALVTGAFALGLFVAGRSFAASGDAGLFTLASFALGAACFVLYPVSVAHAHDRVPQEQSVAASATMVLAYGVGSVVGPLVLSGALELAGAHALPVGLVLFNVALGVLAFLRLARHLRVHEAWRAPFQPLSLPQVAPHGELPATSGDDPASGAP